MIRIARLSAVLLALFAFPILSHAQPVTFNQWFDQRVRDLKLTDINSKAAEKQKEGPAGTPGSTSLVDQSAASDFVSLALGLVPMGRTMTVSAYSLAA